MQLVSSVVDLALVVEFYLVFLFWTIEHVNLIGFSRNIHLSKEVFLCDSCGETPKYIVADGKHCSPSARKVSQLRELASAEDDTHILRKVVISILWVKNKQTTTIW